MILLLSFDVLFICHSFSVASLISYFTNWALVINIIFLSLSVFLHAKNATDTQWYKTLAAHHFFFEVATAMNTLTMIAYWGFIHHIALDTAEFKD